MDPRVVHDWFVVHYTPRDFKRSYHIVVVLLILIVGFMKSETDSTSAQCMEATLTPSIGRDVVCDKARSN